MNSGTNHLVFVNFFRQIYSKPTFLNSWNSWLIIDYALFREYAFEKELAKAFGRLCCIGSFAFCK